MSAHNKILVVDDDPVNLDFFQLMLTKLGFIVEEATDGLDALAKLKKFDPDLILLDNIMPRMSGWELTKNLKADPKYRGIPIIMFSALDDVKDKVAGFELGVDDYITKPFNFSEVLARIKAALRNRELFSQIEVRESRLTLAENLNSAIEQNLAAIIKDIDELATSQGNVQETAKNIREQAADIGAKIENLNREWAELKVNEIAISELQTHLQKFFNQE